MGTPLPLSLRWLLTAAMLMGVATLCGATPDEGRRRASAKAPDALQSESWATGRDGELERFLLEAEVESSEWLAEGITRPRKLLLVGGDTEQLAIFKTIDLKVPAAPDAGQDPYVADKWQYEVAAYRIDRMIGLRMVPVTVMRAIDDIPGSIQQWIDAAAGAAELTKEDSPLVSSPEYAQAMNLKRIFDALIFNADRNPTNILVARADGRVWLIDHSRSFRVFESFPSTVWGRELTLPEPLRERLAGLTQESLDRAVGELLTAEQIAAILARRDRLLRGEND
ncbi:MAG: hypothetical protein JSV80_14335 [Acidobacteriota bacterium]|nr:MAG: hypothetical protein JSV80_14335 [Acidobacteriota bacterium]